MQAQRPVVLGRPRDGGLVQLVAAQGADRVRGGEDDEIGPAARLEQGIVVGEQAADAAGAGDDLVLQGDDRIVVDVGPRLAEEPDPGGRDRQLERVPVGNRESVLLGAAAEALLAVPARSRAQREPQAFQQLEILRHACRIVEHTTILAGR